MWVSILFYLSCYSFGFVLLLIAMLVLDESSKHVSISPKEERFLLGFWCVSVILSVLIPWWISLIVIQQVTWGVSFLCMLTGVFQGATVGPWVGPTLLRWIGYLDQQL